MVRFRLPGQLIPVTLLALLLPLSTIPRVPSALTGATASPATMGPATASTAALGRTTAPGQRVLDVPSALLHREAGVPVIVEMNSPTQAILDDAPRLSSLLAGVRGHLLDALHVAGARNVYAFHLIPAVAAVVPGNKVAALLGEPGVSAVVLDQERPLLDTPDPLEAGVDLSAQASATQGPGGSYNAPQTIEPESFTLTQANIAQAHGFTGAGVRVAVIDSGLDITQPDLAGVVATDTRGRPLRVDFTGTGLQDTVGHGTACASMIAAQGRVLYSGDTRFYQGAPLQVYPPPANPPTVYHSRFHFYGMAPGVRIMSAKIFDTRAPNGGGLDSWIVRAIEWAVANGADVISESFGGLSIPSNGTDPVSLADEAAVRAGVTVVAAAGNAGPGQSTIGSPANAPGIIAVGASTDYRNFGQTGFLASFGHTTADNIAPFSSRGPTTDGRPRPDLVAPGAFGWGLFPMQKSDDGPDHPPFDIGTFGGTSTATPVTAGAAALVIEAFERTHGNVRPSPALVRTILMGSADDLGYPASDQGAGRVDAWRAVLTTIHSGPSFLLGPPSLAIAGPVASPVKATFVVTNSGSTVQRYTFDAQVSRQTGVRQWTGKVRGTALKAYHFTVRPGLERVVGAVYWHSNDRFRVQGANMEVAMRVSLYDPLGRFVNYSYGVGSGYAAAQAARPMPGTWTLVVSENGRKDKAGLRHYTPESFRATLTSFVPAPYGAVQPLGVTLAPGTSARVTVQGTTPRQPGAQIITIHVHGDHTVTVPVALTSYITLGAHGGRFGGVFTGGANAYISLTNENKFYALNVPRGTRGLRVDLSWPNPGYGVFLLLVDPSGTIVDGQFNGIGNGAGNSPFDLSLHNLTAIWSNPTPGHWQIVVMDAVFAGRQRSEPFHGRVTLNDDPVTPRALRRTVVPGASFNVTLSVRNNNGPHVAEGYIGYATTNTYSKVSLGEVHSPFGTPGVVGTDVYTYTTNFVPPGTRRIVVSFATTHPNVPIDLTFTDPIIGFPRAQGHPATITVARHRYKGERAVVAGRELPIGRWGALITLQRPRDAGTYGRLVGVSYADALTPLSWVLFDHGLQNGRITGGQPLILLPGQRGSLHASVTVPLNTPPGIYHAHLFVYTVFSEQAANIPLTIIVRAHAGAERAQSITSCARRLYGVPTCGRAKPRHG